MGAWIMKFSLVFLLIISSFTLFAQESGKQLGEKNQRNIDKLPIEKESAHESYNYRGRSVSEKWINEKYKEFKTQIIYHQDKFYDVGVHYAFAASGAIPLEIPGPPFIFLVDVKILQALDNREFLIKSHDKTYHLIDGLSSWTDDDKVDLLAVVFEGQFKYTSAIGSRNTIDSCRFVPGIFEDQFSTALKQGFILCKYKVTMLPKNVPSKIVKKTKTSEIDWQQSIFDGVLLRNGDKHSFKVICKDIP
jgi:hypothetical protein